MVDIHSHILPGIDDGASSMPEAAEMLVLAYKAGVRKIIATPHFSKDSYDNGLVEEVYKLVKVEAEKYGISLHIGYEVKIQNYPAQMPADYEGITLNGSRYLLLELPFDKVPSYFIDYIYELQLKKYIPILAHPERCLKLITKSHLFVEVIDTGCLLQVDAASIIGVNGRKAKSFAKKIIQKGYVNFIASDAHSPDGYSKWYTKAYKKVQKWIGKEKAEKLFTNDLF